VADNQNNMMQYMANPKAFTVKRWLADLLKNKYPPHDTIAERVSSSLVTDSDLADLGKLIGEIYESGYRKAVDDYRAQFEKLGVKINVVAIP
jgi:hypothetical protein